MNGNSIHFLLLTMGFVALMIACPGPGARVMSQGPGTAVAAGSADPQNLQAKIDRVRAGAQRMRRDGKDAGPVFKLMKNVEPLLKQGKVDEANATIDRALAIVEPGYVPAPPEAPKPSAPMAKPTPAGPTGRGWTHASAKPLIDRSRPPAGLPSKVTRAPVVNWNDPSVMKEGSGYSMWASVGLQGGGKNVAIYKFTSSDGDTWTVANGGKPVLEPGGRRDFDFYGVETPAVIKVGSTYHMYYSAYHDPDPNKGGHTFTMGHATSPDGEHWKKRGELLPLTEVVGKQAGNPWGWLARAEPAVAHHGGKFYLYFCDVRCRKADCSGMPSAVRGISVATSTDGHDFEQIGTKPVLLQTASYPPGQGWEGYSTPWVYHDGSKFQLYVDLFRHESKDKHQQTRISHYQSSNGVDFQEVEADIVKVEGHPWATASVRAPSVIEDGDTIKMWYAGDSFDKNKHTGADVVAGRVYLGIGMASKKR